MAENRRQIKMAQSKVLYFILLIFQVMAVETVSMPIHLASPDSLKPSIFHRVFYVYWIISAISFTSMISAIGLFLYDTLKQSLDQLETLQHLHVRKISSYIAGGEYVVFSKSPGHLGTNTGNTFTELSLTVGSLNRLDTRQLNTEERRLLKSQGSFFYLSEGEKFSSEQLKNALAQNSRIGLLFPKPRGREESAGKGGTKSGAAHITETTINSESALNAVGGSEAIS
jgi:hypothetical protein